MTDQAHQLESMAQQIESLTAQLNALVQVNLRLAAVQEMRGLVDPDSLRADLEQVSWQTDWNDEGQFAIQDFLNQLDEARSQRQKLEQERQD